MTADFAILTPASFFIAPVVEFWMPTSCAGPGGPKLCKSFRSSWAISDSGPTEALTKLPNKLLNSVAHRIVSASSVPSIADARASRSVRLLDGFSFALSTVPCGTKFKRPWRRGLIKVSLLFPDVPLWLYCITNFRASLAAMSVARFPRLRLRFLIGVIYLLFGAPPLRLWQQFSYCLRLEVI